ncbi:unnamed protein product [Rangifer tarandus platyrhynchus]|uniref:Uncharacterized protein n=2 Tax=Rangifer tarandus platyrhynchus TaxID=3082113 RepID=A0ABN8ZFD2_RANTA|nr:unnamed protein product [Rangifer tarandus platyrhynchus]CAI9708531.1 unnamed protein product [Rangifer tarandus platyrhynchus]
MTDKRTDEGKAGAPEPRPPGPNPSRGPKHRAPCSTARTEGASPGSGTPREHSPARGRSTTGAPPSRFIVPPRPRAGEGTGRSCRKRAGAVPAGNCSSPARAARGGCLPLGSSGTTTSGGSSVAGMDWWLRDHSMLQFGL